MNEIGDKLFGNHQGKKQEFDEKIERYDMQYDTFYSSKRKIQSRKLEYQMLETDTGIEIKIRWKNIIPKIMLRSLKEPGGGSTIIIKEYRKCKNKITNKNRIR